MKTPDSDVIDRFECANIYNYRRVSNLVEDREVGISN